jgi:tetratricopeptide (TPR) repeat protein
MDPKALLQRLNAAFQAKQSSKVVHLADQALQLAELAPEYPAILYMRGTSHRRLGPAWDGPALSSFREGLRLAKNRPLKMKFVAALAHFYAIRCDWPALEREVLPTLLKGKNSPNKQVQHSVVWTLFYIGCCLDNHFRYQEARNAYEEALKLARASKEPHAALPSILLNLSGSLLYAGEYGGALVWIKEAAPLQPDDGYLESRWAEYFLAVGDTTTAQEWVTRILTHPKADDGVLANGHFIWAKLFRAKKDLKGAREQAHIALELAYKAVDYPLIQQITTLLRDLEGPQPESND